MKRITRFAVAGTAALMMAAAAPAAMAATPKFPAFAGPPSKNNPVVKPTEIIYSGDGSEFFAGNRVGAHKIGKLHWTVWNGSEGLGTGYQWINNCSPSCANGKFTQYPVTLKAYRPKHESKYYIFTRLKVTYTGKKFGPHKTFTWAVSYSHGFFDI
jgi:hypothetical protein